MMVLIRWELVRMISVSRRSPGTHIRALGQQLAGVAHGADGISDFVGDARGQPAERCELALLHALGHQTGVLEERSASEPARWSPRGAKWGWISRAPSAATKLGGVSSSEALCRQVLSE